MATDPRLTNTSLLALAAYRIQQRRQAAQAAPPDWRYSVGLSSLLKAARAFPERSPWDMPDLEEHGGLGRLLQEAREWEDRHGT